MAKYTSALAFVRKAMFTEGAPPPLGLWSPPMLPSPAAAETRGTSVKPAGDCDGGLGTIGKAGPGGLPPLPPPLLLGVLVHEALDCVEETTARPTARPTMTTAASKRRIHHVRCVCQLGAHPLDLQGTANGQVGGRADDLCLARSKSERLARVRQLGLVTPRFFLSQDDLSHL